MADKDGILEEFANWGGGTKTSRPSSVGPHDRAADQHDPGNPGIDPQKGYKPGVGDNNNRTDPDAPTGPVNIGVKGAVGEEPLAVDSGVTEETKAKTTGMGKAGV